MLKILTKYSVYSCLLLLVACFGGGNYAPIVEHQPRVSKIPEHHIVSRGETLYSIAWRYNMRFSRLASTNKILPPYIIYPSQKIALKATAKPLAKGSSVSQSRSIGGKNPSSPVFPKIIKNTAESSSLQQEKSLAANQLAYPFKWRWPSVGGIVNPYSASSSIHKGIDIKGKLGESVHAANSGKIVYAGSGLIGYGKLLIIKHSESYLSAYGHNSKLMVAEGELVKVGQKIAEFGDTGTDKVKLHFEIRRDGEPVSPLTLLPKR